MIYVTDFTATIITISRRAERPNPYNNIPYTCIYISVMLRTQIFEVEPDPKRTYSNYNEPEPNTPGTVRNTTNVYILPN